MSEAALRVALEAAGVRCDVEGEDRLALLRLHGDTDALADAALRARVTRLAAEHGYTHVALELPIVDAEH
jgi:hypothetical protein